MSGVIKTAEHFNRVINQFVLFPWSCFLRSQTGRYSVGANCLYTVLFIVLVRDVFRGWVRSLHSNEVPFKGTKVYSSVELKSHSYYSSCCCVSVGCGSNPLSAGFAIFSCLTADKCSLYGLITILCRLLESICFLRCAPFMLQECRQTAATGEKKRKKKNNSSLMVLIFWCFSAPPNPTELVSISADGKQRRTRREREKRGEVEKTKQILRHAAWGGEALQADRRSFIFLPNWGEDFQTPSEAEGIPANREEGWRRRCQSQCETKRLIRPRV